MKKKVLFALFTLCLFIGLALGATIKNLPVPATWASTVGNYFRVKSDANLEVRKTGLTIAGAGTNTFTGSTTNVALTNNLTLVVVNGVVVGVKALE